MTSEQEACGLIQTKHTVPGSILYSSYWYRSGVNRTMTENLHGIARGVEAIVPLESGDLVVDIGCNDGTLLKAIRPRACATSASTRPTSARNAIAKGYASSRTSSPRQPRARLPAEGQGNHVNRDVLRPRGPGHVRVRRAQAWPRTASGSSSCTTCHDARGQRVRHDLHEHLEYYSLAVIERLVGEEGLEVVAAELNDMNGGSIRLFIGHAGQHERTPEQLEALTRATRQRVRAGARLARALRGSSAWAPSESATSCWRCARSSTAKARRSTSTAPRRRATRSFSTRASTQLHRGGRRPQPRQVGLGDARTKIPIISEEDSRAMKPDYYLALRGTSSRSSSSASRSSSSAAVSSSCRCRRFGWWGPDCC